MRKTLIGASGAMMALLTMPALAQTCVKPVPPEVVADKNSLTLEQRNVMVAQIDAYIAAMNVYLACLEQSDAKARAEAEAILRQFEAPIDDLEIVQ